MKKFTALLIAIAFISCNDVSPTGPIVTPTPTPQPTATPTPTPTPTPLPTVTPTPTPSPSSTLSVVLRPYSHDFNTYIYLFAGQRFHISASGLVKADPMFDANGPDGVGRLAPSTGPLTYPLPGNPRFGLVGRVGDEWWNGRPLNYFFAGSSYSGQARRDGHLYLMINDGFEGLGNNTGSFVVEVTVQ